MFYHAEESENDAQNRSEKSLTVFRDISGLSANSKFELIDLRRVRGAPRIYLYIPKNFDNVL